MVYSLHKFKHFLLGNKFVSYVDDMALVRKDSKMVVIFFLKMSSQ
jgi:hypothetical protein